MKKLIAILGVILLTASLFAESYLVTVTGKITKKTAEGEFVEITGECYIDEEDTLYLEEDTMITFQIGNSREQKLKGPKPPIKFGELLTKLKLK